VLNRHTRMSNRWLETCNLPTIITNSQGIEGIKAHTRQQWKERIDNEDIRYKGKPGKRYGHLKDLSRASFRNILYLRATSGWPDQATDGTRGKCPCNRDIITHTHLMSFCGIVQGTKLGQHNNRTINELEKWIKTWPDSLGNHRVRIADRTIHRVQTTGAAINIPTTQTVAQDREWRNGRWYIQCRQCPKMVENTKREKAKHENTHKPRTGKTQ